MEGRIYTREQIEQIFEHELDVTVKRWGTNSFWANSKREANKKRLERFDNGEVIEVDRDAYYENGMDFERVFMSDGTVKNICYGWAD